MKTRNIKKQFETQVNLGFKNLIVSGCSYTYNNSETAAVTWPYYLRDLAGFDTVYDSSLPGAGNYHICLSLMWTLDNLDCDRDSSLVVVMASGNNRDDAIVAAECLNDYPMQFNYAPSVAAGITGGNHATSGGNNLYLKNIDKAKTLQSRSIENYLYLTALHSYLIERKYKFVILDYLDRSVPNLSNDFDITNLLPNKLRGRYKNLFANQVKNIYRFAVMHDLLESDNFHPSPDGHLRWTKECLLPFLSTFYTHESEPQAAAGKETQLTDIVHIAS